MIDDRAGFADMVMLILGMRVTKMIEVAATLGLADLIDEEPRPIEDLSDYRHRSRGASPALPSAGCLRGVPPRRPGKARAQRTLSLAAA